MDATTERARRRYGAHPLHLLTLLASFALVGYVISLLGVHSLWNDRVWWQSIIVWFLGAIVLHDLVLFPFYALADRSLGAGWRAVTGRAPQADPGGVAPQLPAHPGDGERTAPPDVLPRHHPAGLRLLRTCHRADPGAVPREVAPADRRVLRRQRHRLRRPHVPGPPSPGGDGAGRTGGPARRGARPGGSGASVGEPTW